MSIELLLVAIISTCVLVLAHLAVRVGLPQGALSAAEGFILGHWPFIILNMYLLAMGRTFGWADPSMLGAGPILQAALVVGLGLFGFVTGTLLLSSRGMPVLATPPEEVDLGATAVVTAVLVVTGAGASFVNGVFAVTGGFGARQTELVAVAQLLVPGAVLAWSIVISLHASKTMRGGALALFAVSGAAMTFEWSRRYLVVVVAAVWVLSFSRRALYPLRRALGWAAPFLLVVAAFGLAWRNFLIHHAIPETLAPDRIVEKYVNALWLDSSAFSALASIVRDHGFWAAHGFGSIFAAFIFWLPRSLFPWKPSAFQLSTELGVDTYNVAPSIYGEVLYDGSVLAVPLFLLALGLVMRAFDRYAVSRPGDMVRRCVLCVVAMDAAFLVRGAFHTMFFPMLVHTVIPFALLSMVTVVRGRLRS